MSNVPAFRPSETARLREALKSQREWICHWRKFLDDGLTPTRESLADAEDEIRAALAEQKECTDA